MKKNDKKGAKTFRPLPTDGAFYIDVGGYRKQKVADAKQRWSTVLSDGRIERVFHSIKSVLDDDDDILEAMAAHVGVDGRKGGEKGSYYAKYMKQEERDLWDSLQLLLEAQPDSIMAVNTAMGLHRYWSRLMNKLAKDGGPRHMHPIHWVFFLTRVKLGKVRMKAIMDEVMEEAHLRIRLARVELTKLMEEHRNLVTRHLFLMAENYWWREMARRELGRNYTGDPKVDIPKIRKTRGVTRLYSERNRRDWLDEEFPGWDESR